MKKFILIVAISFTFFSEAEAQLNYRDSSFILLLNDVPYAGNADSLQKIPKMGFYPSEKTGKDFLVFGNYLKNKNGHGWAHIYTRDLSTGFWNSIMGIRLDIWNSYGFMKKMEKISASEIKFFFDKKTLHLVKREQPNPYWVIEDD
ncbi:MAG: hypothetical protein V4665_04550 [Patescibacteria group bacterium]